MNTLVDVCAVRVTLGKTPALRGVDFSLQRGEHTVITGRNGSGKSTLLRLIRGDIAPDQQNGGEIIWYTPEGPERFAALGQRLSALVSSAQLEKYVSKGWRINGETVVLTGFPDTPLLYGEPSAPQREAVRALAARFDMLPLLERELPELSHGQLRLLLLARACIRKPTMLLLDECTDGLDIGVRERVNALLEEMALSSTLLAVAHRMDTLPACIRRAVELDAGRVRADRQRIPHAALASRLVTLHPDSQVWSAPEQQDSSLGEGFDLQLGDTFNENLPLINIVNADVYVGDSHVLHKVNWRICPGEQWAVIGHNGAGKSTLLRLLCGVENAAFGGRIERRLPGQGEGIIVELERMRRGIGIVSDRIQATYWYDLTAEELVCSGFERSVGLMREPTQAERDEAHGWMEQLGVSALVGRKMRAVSTGQLRRLMLARALVGSPDLVLLDEPCSGLDPESRAGLLQQIDACACAGTHFVLVTHHEADLTPSITHVAYLENGRMTRRGAIHRSATP